MHIIFLIPLLNFCSANKSEHFAFAEYPYNNYELSHNADDEYATIGVRSLDNKSTDSNQKRYLNPMKLLKRNKGQSTSKPIKQTEPKLNGWQKFQQKRELEKKKKEEIEYNRKSEEFRRLLQSDVAVRFSIWVENFNFIKIDKIYNTEFGRQCLNKVTYNFLEIVSNEVSSRVVKDCMAYLKSGLTKEITEERAFVAEREIYFCFISPEALEFKIVIFKEMKEYFNDNRYWEKEYVKGKPQLYRNDETITIRLKETENDRLLNDERLIPYIRSFFNVVINLLKTNNCVRKIEIRLWVVRFLINLLKLDYPFLQRFFAFLTKVLVVKPIKKKIAKENNAPLVTKPKKKWQ